MEFVWCFVYCTYVVVISDHVRWNVCRSSFHRFLVSTSRNMIVHFSLCSRYLRIFWKLKNIIFLPCSCLFCAWLHKKRHIDFYWIFRLFVSLPDIRSKYLNRRITWKGKEKLLQNYYENYTKGINFKDLIIERYVNWSRFKKQCLFLANCCE